MRDEPRSAPDGAPDPSAQPPAPRPQRHPALRPRLGDIGGDIGEAELRAFSTRPQGATPKATPGEPGHAAADKPAGRKKGQRAKGTKAASGATGNAPGGAPGSASAGPTARKMVRRQGSFKVRLRKFTLWVLLPCALAGGAGWAMTSPRLAVSGVDVSGVDATPEALVQPISAALTGQNWLRADLSAARSRLAKLPTVQFANVSRAWSHWPPRLSVRIQERRPWLRLGGGGSWWVVDRTGIAFRRATREDRALYAVTATGFDPASLRAGQKVPPKFWDSTQRLALALDESSKKGGPWPIRRAYLDQDGMASLRLEGGPQDGMLVRLGDGLWPQKMERARRAMLFFQEAGRRAESLNLVSFSMPTWTPLQPHPAAPAAPAGTVRGGDSGPSPSRKAPTNDAANAVTITPPDTTGTAPRNEEEAAASTSTARGSRTSSGSEIAPDVDVPHRTQMGAAEGQGASDSLDPERSSEPDGSHEDRSREDRSREGVGREDGAREPA